MSTAVVRNDDNESRAVQKRPSEMLADARERIEPYLPPGIPFDVVMSDVFIATKKNPELLKCDPQSLVLAVVEANQRGLRIGVTCHLVPKGGRVVVFNDIRGDIEQIVRSGAARGVTAKPVYANELFEYEERIGTPHLRHAPIADPATRGDLLKFYAIFYINTMRAQVHVMSVEDVDAIRQQYSLSWKRGVLPVWYGLKTTIRQGAKYLPKNAAMMAVYAAWERDEEPTAPDILPARGHALASVDSYGQVQDEQPAGDVTGDTSVDSRTSAAPASLEEGPPARSPHTLNPDFVAEAGVQQREFAEREAAPRGGRKAPVSMGELPFDEAPAPRGKNAIAEGH